MKTRTKTIFPIATLEMAGKVARTTPTKLYIFVYYYFYNGQPDRDQGYYYAENPQAENLDINNFVLSSDELHARTE